MPSTSFAGLLGQRTVLILGTLLSAGGYALAGASGGLLGLCIALMLAGAGSSTQHPLASAVIARAYGRAARGPLGTYNFAGDLGKAIVPPLVGLLLSIWNWRMALWLIAGLGVVVALAVGRLLPNDRPTRNEPASPAVVPAARGGGSRLGFVLLVVIGMLDNAARPAFLIYLPFLMQAKGASLTAVGFALSLVFIGGALGKAVCGWIGHSFGVTRTVVFTEAGTAVAILAVIALPLVATLAALPLLGVMLNGTCSVLYGTVPELAPDGRLERAFAIFYTSTLGASAIAMPLLYGRLGDAIGPRGATMAAAATAFAVIPLMFALSPYLHSRASARMS